MLQEVFYWIFNMSIAASITGGLVMLLRLIRWIPRRISIFLWMIPFIRMAFPLGVNSPYGLMALISKITSKTVTVYQLHDEIVFSSTNYIMLADSYFPVVYRTSTLENIFSVASLVWIVVLLAIILMMLVTYFTTMHEIKASAHFTDNIYLSDKVISPAVYGIIRPKIILPVDSKDRELIILHEKTHIKRLDNLWRILAFMITALHWFNPLSWIFLKEFLADIELSCDECVIKRLGTDHIKEYALTLIESKKGTTVFASTFGGAKIRTRIENILSFKKLTGFSLIVFTVMLGVIFYALLTNAG